MSSARSEFLAGVRAVGPVLIGIVPFAMVSGITAIHVGVSPGMALLLSVIVFAGSAQLVALQLLGAGAPSVIIALSAIIVNLRFVMYSASIASHLTRLSNRWKVLLAYMLTDQAYAVTIVRFEESADRDHQHWFLLGAELGMWITWQIGTAMGLFLGAQVPAKWSLDFTVTLTFLALVVPAIKDRAIALAALAAGGTALLMITFPFKLGLITAALVGVLVGLIAEAKSR